ncbi:54S ribosomal protein L24, mitochondrial [Hanseniaspora osmophila]|uniref:54S ribosomal protein L24, mitochondrial n=1 Tax=Hanseniaspora osmophila TaxID=56408 RepID=A0A1E5RF98_9ASCO|nr:54S ribosomal protein L24, mitochondrial [Hanseniaspora osmophila]
MNIVLGLLPYQQQTRSNQPAANMLPFMKKSFSTLTVSTPLLREWKLVTTRRVRKTPDYQIGDIKPVGVPKVRPLYPVYKYGESNIFKQSNRGLYGAQFIQTGNTISESKKKNRRVWKLNVFKKKLWSESLNKFVNVKMTGKVYRTIIKDGGIDMYLTKTSSARVKELGPTGWKLRYLVLKYKNLKERLANNVVETILEDGNANSSGTPVYFVGTINDVQYKITCGKRKLLQLLYPLELVATKEIDGVDLRFNKFNMENQQLSVEEILQKLDHHGFDLKSISA